MRSGFLFRDAANVAEEIGFVDDRYDTFSLSRILLLLPIMQILILGFMVKQGRSRGKFPWFYKELLY